MGALLPLDSRSLANLADKVIQARKLYAKDSAYVIGLFTGMEWLLEAVEGGEGAKRQLLERVLESEGAKVSRSSVAAAAPGKGAGLEENAWNKGMVKWFNNDKGYGFISTEGNTDVFVHWRDISSWDRSLSQGDEVEFMVTKTAKGFQAINVMKAGREERVPGESPAALETREATSADSAAAKEETGEEDTPSSPPAWEAQPEEADDGNAGGESGAGTGEPLF